MKGISSCKSTRWKEKHQKANGGAEIRRVSKSLLLKFEDSAKGLFPNLLSQTDENIE